MGRVLEGRAYEPVKRGLDIVASAAGLVLLSPVMAITALLVKKNLGSPVIFRQDRPGRHGKIFTLYKFRSLKNEKYPGQPDDERLTLFGEKLRASSVDEFPELWNVLKGDMSLVGPRPLLIEYLA